MKNARRMKKTTIVIIVLLCLALATAAVMTCSRQGDEEPEPAAAIDTTAVLATRMEQCSRLYTTEYQMRKILVYDNPATISGSILHQDFSINLPLGKRRIAIPVTATAKAYVDMGKLTEDNVLRNGDKLEIILPDPEVVLTATTIDHNGVRQHVSILRSRFSDEEITRIQQQGRQQIVSSLKKTGIIEDARKSAARQLIPIAEQMGFKEENITITFRKDITPDGLGRLIRIQG